nr:hypothetical protein [Tanacetum cinerariifolium]
MVSFWPTKEMSEILGKPSIGITYKKGYFDTPREIKGDHGTPSEASVGGKSCSALQRLFAGAVLNAKVGVTVAPTLPFVAASVSTTPEHSSHHPGPTIAEAKIDSLVTSSTLIMTTATTDTSMVDSTLVAKEKTVKPSLFFADSFSASGADPNTGVFRILLAVISSVTNGSRLDDGRVCHEMVDEFAPLKFFVSVLGMEHDQLFTEFNVRVARQISLSVEVRMRAKSCKSLHLRAEASNFETIEKSLQDEVNALKKWNTILEKEQNARDVKAIDLKDSTIDKERELTNLKVQLTAVHELEVSSAKLQEKLSSYESLTKRLREFQDPQLKIVKDKFDKLYADFVEMALHLEEKFYPHLLSTIFSRRWLLTHGMELALVNCLHSPECLSALRAAVGKAIKKGMQDGLLARIIHNKEGRVLTDSNKDASIETVMDILHLENPLAERLGLTELSALRDVFIPLAEPFSAVVLTGSEGTSNVMPTIVDTTTVMSATLASVSTIAPIFVDDYEVLGMDDQAGANGNAKPFLNMSADVARGHEGDDGGDDRPPPHESAEGCRAKSRRQESQQDAYPKESQKFGLRKITDELCPQSIKFEWKDNGTMLPLGDHLAHWDNLLREIKIRISIFGFGLIPRTWPGVLKMLETEQRTRSYAGRDPRHLLPIRDIQIIMYVHMHNSTTQEYPSLIQTFFDIHTVGDIFLRDENRRLYEMVRLQGLGTYIDDQIMAMVRRGKRRGHIPGVDRVFAGRGKDVLDVPVPQCNHTSDLQSQHDSGIGSRCGAGEDDESGDDEDADEDADS